MELLASQAVERFHNRGTWLMRLCILALLSLLNFTATAMEVEELFVTEREGEYQLRIISVLDAPADYVYDVVVDYKHAYRINPTITEVEILNSSRREAIRVRNHSEHWIGPFCLDINWIGDIEENEHGYIKVDTIPGEGSFESGSAIWVIHPQGERTWVLHDSALKPNFFIPPVIGGHIMKNRMQDNTLDTFRRIECYAKIKFELDMENEPELSKDLLKSGADCTEATEVTSAFSFADE
jgi:hypothetical protein